MKRSNYLRIGLVCTLFLAACGKLEGNYFAPTAAVVCVPPQACSKIPESEIALRLRRVMLTPETARQFRGPQGASTRLSAQREILNALISEELLQNEAKKLRLTASNAEVQAQLNQLESRYPSKAAFNKAVTAEGLTLPEVRNFLRDQIVYGKVAASVTAQVKPTEQEIVDFYNQNKARYEEQIRVAHILVCEKFDQSNREAPCTFSPEDETLAKSLTARARKGEDFAALAKEFSKDPSNASTGGELPPFGRGQMVSEFETAAFALPAVGAISDPVKTLFGWHVIKLLQKGKTLDEARPEIEAAIKQQQDQKAYAEWLQATAGKAKIRVNPKFGRYDQASHTVVPARQAQQSSPEPFPGP
jgi:foldase protein PrsA